MNDRKKNLLENRFSDRSIHLIRPFTQSELSDKIDMGLYPNTSHSQPAPQSLFNVYYNFMMHNTTQFLRRKNMNHEVAPKKSKNDLNGLNFKMFGMPPPNTDSTQDTDSKLQNTNSGLSDFSISTPDSWSMGEFDKHVQTSLTCLKMQHIENNKIAELEEKNDRINVLQEKILECDSMYTKQKEDMECLSQKHKQMNEIIVDLLINKSKVERNNDETKTNLKMLSLGHFTMQRCGSSFQEKWIEGSSFIKLYGNQKSLKKERENFEKEKKSILKRKPQYISQIKTNSRESSSKESGLEPKMENELSWDEYYEYENILKLRLMSLRKEELDLQIELDRLDRDRNVHIREIRRLKNQANSEFNDYPFLNERYLLLNLLGKGGFSEVYMAFDTKDNIYTACKIHQLNKDWKEEKKSNYIRHALREADIHKKLNHKRIVGLLEVFELDNNS
ncbi:hypothetical protein A3Q56_07061 [Intoshia linei]|uniref:Protein kinase domain-containing protein n=1 Tax=Intoshia linei TaxID=1819745 RepID=A0A177AT86_9BILA|nr:hypothetical protein A3Q56_07061 [Intoshia linei]